MAKLKFGAWVPTYAWSGKKTDPKNMRRIRDSIVKCEKYGIDVWVIDHLLSAPGLYGNAWLEPLSSLAYAAALTLKVDIATGMHSNFSPFAAVQTPVGLEFGPGGDLFVASFSTDSIVRPLSANNRANAMCGSTSVGSISIARS